VVRIHAGWIGGGLGVMAGLCMGAIVGLIQWQIHHEEFK